MQTFNPLFAEFSAFKLYRDRLRSSDSPPSPRPTLSSIQPRTLALDRLRGFLDYLGAFGEDEFDVAGVGHVGVNLPVKKSTPEISLLVSTHIGDQGQNERMGKGGGKGEGG